MVRKATMLGISNRTDEVLFTFKKNILYDTLFELFKKEYKLDRFMYQEPGEKRKISKFTDQHNWVKQRGIKVEEFIGKNKVFLLVISKKKSKIVQFISKNSIMPKPKKLSKRVFKKPKKVINS